jgi:hypothetical protein
MQVLSRERSYIRKEEDLTLGCPLQVAGFVLQKLEGWRRNREVGKKLGVCHVHVLSVSR